ncbi:MAG TPA: SigE family RNA polymerase sigma factor [Trebonia sp.]|jgi:RNA polymerase sigma-70 factor (sigma-E family)
MDTSRRPGRAPDADPGPDGHADATGGVTELYRGHSVGLIRLAIVMLGDRVAAEDVVQDAFLGLYRHWDGLADPGKALTYVRSAVLNRCRNALRQRHHDVRRDDALVVVESAEATVLVGEEHQLVLAAIRALPDRQREALVLRFYLELSEDETARAMGISKGTVKSATSRAVAALGRMLKEDQ